MISPLVVPFMPEAVHPFARKVKTGTGTKIVVKCLAKLEAPPPGRYIDRRDSRESQFVGAPSGVTGCAMSEAFVELLFWIVVFIIFFFGFKKLQKRKEERRAQEAAREADQHSTGRD
jgi:hypothetical protein